ncbi:hypothetical protein [Rhizobium wenxiniae]|uniref:hypothetical protein n=1 Tax=Rhizobium wenxiniae TaxID=1737357 RepID=UPI00161648C7|nr:hypothetical protein [Rhizobium wenxiniae]
MDLQGGRLVAGCLADHNFLHELPHEIDEGLFRFRVGVLAHVIEGGVDDQFDGLRTDLGLQLSDPPPKILHLGRLVQPGLEAGTAFLDPVEHIVERSQARPPLGRTIADLLDDLTLFLLGSLQRPGNLLGVRRVGCGSRLRGSGEPPWRCR